MELSAIEFFGTLRTDETAAAMRRKLLSEEEERRRHGEFRLCDDRPFWGILSYLSEECGGNVHLKGIVNITSSSDDRNKCHQVTDYGWNDYWRTKDEEDSWICFDFKDKTVRLTKYSVKSGGCHYLHDWVIEGSNDGCLWKGLDWHRMECVKEYYITNTYECGGLLESLFSKGFRYLRVREIGNPSLGSVLSLSAIEFFGTLHSVAK